MSNPGFDLTGKRALVCGAGGGIGQACVRLLGAAGARLFLSGTREAKLDPLSAELGNRCAYLALDPPGEGSPELASALGEVFGQSEIKAVLLAEHGVIAAGKDLTQAQNLAELVEESAQVALLAKGLQDAPEAS